MERFIIFTVNGVAQGAILASIALALVIIWRTTRVLNFAQGAQATVSAYVAWVVIEGTGSYWLAFGAALLSGVLLGAVIQQTVFRTAESMPPLNTVIVGVALLILIQAVLAMLFSPNTTRALRAAFGDTKLSIGDLTLISRQQIFVIVSVVTAMAALGYLMARTPVGLRMRAAAFAPETSRLMGVRVPQMLTLGWALAGAMGALAAMLVLPSSVELVPQGMNGIFVLGFTAAVVGGLDSPVGAVVGGLLCGLALSYTTGYLSPTLLYPASFALLVVVLLVRPEGLFAVQRARRV